MGVSGQRHAPAALYPRGKDPRYPLDRIRGWVGPRAGLDAGARRKILYPCRGSNFDRPIIQPVVRNYTTWATAAHWHYVEVGYIADVSQIRTVSIFKADYPIAFADTYNTGPRIGENCSLWFIWTVSIEPWTCIVSRPNCRGHCVDQWFPNGVSGGTTRCVAKLKKIFQLRLMMIINNWTNDLSN
jgi:hypothetical protein